MDGTLAMSNIKEFITLQAFFLITEDDKTLVYED